MNTKKIVFLSSLSLLAIIFVTENPILFGFCQNIDIYNEGMKRCVEESLLPEYITQIGGFLSILVLSLSLITYFMRDEVFRAWWGFARWWVPVIIVVTFLLNSANGGGGLGIGGAVSSAFDILVIGILHAVLIITSLVKIVRTYFKIRKI